MKNENETGVSKSKVYPSWFLLLHGSVFVGSLLASIVFVFYPFFIYRSVSSFFSPDEVAQAAYWPVVGIYERRKPVVLPPHIRNTSVSEKKSVIRISSASEIQAICDAINNAKHT